MRRDELWNLRAGGYIEPLYPGYNILVRGTDKYVNFGVTVGDSGYGFRDNAGSLEYKNSGGGWISFSSVFTTDHGSLTGLGDDDHPQYVLGVNTHKLTVSATEPTSPSVGDLWVQIS
jgi:hypothetical protein